MKVEICIWVQEDIFPLTFQREQVFKVFQNVVVLYSTYWLSTHLGTFLSNPFITPSTACSVHMLHSSLAHI